MRLHHMGHFRAGFSGRAGTLAIFAGLSTMALNAPALAQKAADTVRVALSDPLQTTLVYDDQKPEIEVTSPSVYDTLMCFDRKAQAFTPLLAKSWRRIDERTLEFSLREDVKFHDGTPFTADDVVYTLTWAINPASKLRFAPQESNLGWIEKVEKIDAATVRIVARKPTPLDMMRLAVLAPIVSAKAHSALANKADYGRKPAIGTGPYRMVTYDASKGATFARNEDYRHGSPCKPAASISKAVVMQIPDAQTQLAQIMVGDLDITKSPGKDEAEAMARNPDVRLSTLADTSLHVLQFDIVGRSGNKALGNLAVRRAMAKAINRLFIGQNVMAGGTVVHAFDSLCIPIQVGCGLGNPPPAYDLAAARAEIAAAGFPNGFDTEITALPASYSLADGVAGELRKIGIRASVDKATFTSFRQKQADGKIQLMIGQLPTLTSLDASTVPTYYFDGSVRDFAGDAEMQKLNDAGLSTIDVTKRQEIYRQMANRNNEMVFVLPLVTSPQVFIHSKDLAPDVNSVHPEGVSLYDLRWK